MEYLTGIGLLVAFLVVVVMIVRGQSPIIMLLLLAIVWALIAVAVGLLFWLAKPAQGPPLCACVRE